MGVRSGLKEILRRFGYAFVPLAENEGLYDVDGLITIHNHDFIKDPAFQSAYARGVKAAGEYHWKWRVHIGLWAASTASRLPGDFLECGVNRGFLSTAIMSYLDWDSTGKTFYLVDTFAGLDDKLISDGSVTESERNRMHLDEGFYVTDLDSVRANFSEWRNVRIIPGAVPVALDQLESREFAYVHLDMNSAAADSAAFETLWPTVARGGIILLDDYAFCGYRDTKIALDKAANKLSVEIASLPTGQGLVVKT
jgi:hypothetical protein